MPDNVTSPLDLLPGAEDVRAAQRRLVDVVPPSPLVALDLPERTAPVQLKLESLHSVGSFKVRGATNAMLAAAEAGTTGRRVWTASAGNMGLGVAWCARRLQWEATIVVPDTAPRVKVDTMRQLGATVLETPWDQWWATVLRGTHPSVQEALYIHPFADREVMAGNATIGVELVEQAGQFDTVYVPFGGGGLACGIAAGLRSAGSNARVVPCESDHGAPLAAAQRAGRPVPVERTASFIDGVGSTQVADDMWSVAQRMLSDSVVVDQATARSCVRLLARSAHVVAEGAGAVALGASLQGAGERAACIISGANIDHGVLADILSTDELSSTGQTV